MQCYYTPTHPSLSFPCIPFPYVKSSNTQHKQTQKREWKNDVIAGIIEYIICYATFQCAFPPQRGRKTTVAHPIPAQSTWTTNKRTFFSSLCKRRMFMSNIRTCIHPVGHNGRWWRGSPSCKWLRRRKKTKKEKQIDKIKRFVIVWVYTSGRLNQQSIKWLFFFQLKKNNNTCNTSELLNPIRKRADTLLHRPLSMLLLFLFF